MQDFLLFGLNAFMFIVLNHSPNLTTSFYRHKEKRVSFYVKRPVVFAQDMGKPSETSLPLLKNDITGSEPTVKILDT